MDGLMQENYGSRYSETLVGNDLRLITHKTSETERYCQLELVTRSQRYGVQAVMTLRAPKGCAALNSTVTVTNLTDTPRTITSISSLSAYVTLGSNALDQWKIYSGKSDWTGEDRWRSEPMRSYEIPDLLGPYSMSSAAGLSSTITPVGATMTRMSFSSRSTGDALPAGAMVEEGTNAAIFWQIEENGPWLWQIGERVDGLYLSLYGPTDIEHHWSIMLDKGQSFTTATASVAVSNDGFNGALGQITRYRRATVRKHPDHNKLPVIFNDYMNTLMGDPTTEKEIPLIDAAAQTGAEYYCIDCGWYDDSGDWWPSVGEWKPSTKRFPGGLRAVIDHILRRGMKPGIWLEPEVIGVKSPMAEKLPDEAFMQRNGKRIQTHYRYLLDLRNPAAQDHLNNTVDHLVNDMGIQFFKFDYNVNTGAGTNFNADSRGEGQLECGRAYIHWLDGILDRHPDVTVETCSAGAMRTDWGLLSHSQLQSTSDQQDYRQYANIAACSPVLILPEQCGNWAYPNCTMSPEQTMFTMINGMVGRLYLSGYLTQMSQEQRAIVKEALDVYKDIRLDIRKATPFWPFGLPQWNDNVICYGLRVNEQFGYLAIWRKEGTNSDWSIPLSGNEADFLSLNRIYGVNSPVEWNPSASRVTIHSTVSDEPYSALFRISYSR
jgi:alpha-galactosidase